MTDNWRDIYCPSKGYKALEALRGIIAMHEAYGCGFDFWRTSSEVFNKLSIEKCNTLDRFCVDAFLNGVNVNGMDYDEAFDIVYDMVYMFHSGNLPTHLLNCGNF